jgi:NitT/TauT family transport system substrate-binding protein
MASRPGTRTCITRRRLVGGMLTAPAVLAAWRPASAAEPVSIGMVNTISDAGFFVAAGKGYFEQEGLEVKFLSFRAGAAMISPLASGDLDVGAGAVSAGLFNANERQIPIKIVADKARNAPGYGFQSLLLRRALMESGRFKSFADLRGLRVAIPSIGSAGEQSILNEALKRGGLTYADCEKVFLGINDQVAAFKNGAIDVSVISEPLISITVKEGLTSRFATVDTFYPNQQAAVVFYGAQFAAKRPDAAKRLMKAYLRGVRGYNDALQDGRIAGPQADEIVDYIARYSVTKDRDLIRGVIPSAVDPDGAVNVQGLTKDLDFIKSLGLVAASASVEQIIDPSFAEAAVAELGRYRKT